MTREEFRAMRKRQQEIKDSMPAIYNDILQNYEHYQMRYAMNKCKIDALYYELEGVKAVDLTKERGTYNKDAHIEKYYSLSDEIGKLEQENSFIETVLKALESIRDGIVNTELRNRITEGYFNVIYG